MGSPLCGQQQITFRASLVILTREAEKYSENVKKTYSVVKVAFLSCAMLNSSCVTFCINMLINVRSKETGYDGNIISPKRVYIM